MSEVPPAPTRRDRAAEPMEPRRAVWPRRLWISERCAAQRVEAILEVLPAPDAPVIECRDQGPRQREDQNAGVERTEPDFAGVEGEVGSRGFDQRRDVECLGHR